MLMPSNAEHRYHKSLVYSTLVGAGCCVHWPHGGLTVPSAE